MHRICVVTPAPPQSTRGNRVTAQRWTGLLRDLGHHVQVRESYDDEPCDVLVALHARRSATSIVRFHEHHPQRPIVLALTGTDVYRDIHSDAEARRSLELADRYVVLQPLAIQQLSAQLQPRAHVVVQSAVPPPGPNRPSPDLFEVSVLAHLREVKDPLRAGRAARLLPARSRVRVVHAGGVLDEELARAAKQEMATNPRYTWLGELPRRHALQILARSRCMVLSSTSEGGANVVSEALACRVPIIASRIPGSVGILGDNYPGYFTPGDTAELAAILHRVETDRGLQRSLHQACARLAPLVEPATERESWRHLLASL
ncbi:MAG: TIGR04348 family glycosyltransferase [Actinomycetota bacterium]|nr:TIGR04348 family glycosyltransferase [Actinomycetota bacterium]